MLDSYILVHQKFFAEFVNTYLTKVRNLHLVIPRHLCRGVYSFCLSVRMFVRLFVRSFVHTSFRRMEFVSKFCVKVSQVVYISATTHQKAFIFGQ